MVTRGCAFSEPRVRSASMRSSKLSAAVVLSPSMAAMLDSSCIIVEAKVIRS